MEENKEVQPELNLGLKKKDTEFQEIAHKLVEIFQKIFDFADAIIKNDNK